MGDVVSNLLGQNLHKPRRPSQSDVASQRGGTVSVSMTTGSRAGELPEDDDRLEWLKHSVTSTFLSYATACFQI